MEALRIEGVTKIFGKGELEVTAVKDVSFTVQRGELVALLGPSGSGKTTLLLTISLILEPTAGTVAIDEEDVFREGRTLVDMRSFRRRKIGFVFQAHNLIPFLDVRDNVALIAQLNGAPKRAARERADALLDYLEIGHRARSLPAKLSGGEQQRVAIARALANEPRIVLADEPTASLDTQRGKAVMDLLRRLGRERKAAVIAVTHDERMIEGFDRVYHMIDGRIDKSWRPSQPAIDGEWVVRPTGGSRRPDLGGDGP